MPGTCRLCLSISFVNNYIFDDDNKIYLKILACLPVKVARDDKLPKSICNMCSCKVDDFYQFCNRAVEAENKLSGLHDNYQVASDNIEKKENHVLESRTTQPNSFSQPVNNISLPPSRNGFNTSSKNHTISQRLSLPGAVQMTVVKRETLSPPHSWSDLPNHITTYTQTDDWSNVIKVDEIKEEASASSNRDINNDFQAVPYSVYPGGVTDSRGKRTKDRKKKGKKSKKKRKLKKSNSGHAIKTEYHSDSDDNVSLKKLKTSRRKNCNGLQVAEDLNDIKIEAMDHFTDKIDSDSDHFVDEVTEDLDVDDDWNCCVCFKRFFNKPDTMKHYRTHYSSPPFDKKTVMNDCLEVQKSDCKKNLYECCFCDMAFHAKSALSNHMNTHGSDKPYQCSLCEKTFKTPLEILKHGKSSHKFMATSEGGDLDVIDGCPRPATKRFMCDICDEAFVYMKYVLSHRLVSHPEARGRQLVNRCLHCRREFTHLNSLRRHLRSHSGLRNFLCNICGKALTSREHLKFHIRIHTGFKPNVCKTCGKGFVKKCNLTLHERVHSGERPYVCSHCGKAFSQRSTLVIHERYHSGARPYVCTLCQKGFVAKGLLSMHLKTSCI